MTYWSFLKGRPVYELRPLASGLFLHGLAPFLGGQHIRKHEDATLIEACLSKRPSWFYSVFCGICSKHVKNKARREAFSVSFEE